MFGFGLRISSVSVAENTLPYAPTLLQLGDDRGPARLVGLDVVVDLVEVGGQRAGARVGRLALVHLLARKANHLGGLAHLAAQRARVQRRRQPLEDGARRALLAGDGAGARDAGAIGEDDDGVDVAGVRGRVRRAPARGSARRARECRRARIISSGRAASPWGA